MPVFPPLDALALAWFLIAWIGYTAFAERRRGTPRSLLTAMDTFRLIWMERMHERDLRIVDTQIVGNLLNIVTFFASTSLIVVGGLIAVFGALDQAIAVLSDVPFAVETSRTMWKAKLLVLLTIFVYAFFKYTWSLRQFNYCSILIGAAPPVDADPDSKMRHARRIAEVSSHASTHFNRGLRAYYFGLAVLTWFLHPLLFMAVSAFVTLVLYRREFHSRTLDALLGDRPEGGPGA